MDISTTLAAIASAKDFAALLIGRKIDAAVTEKAIELQNSIIALQSGLLEMQAQIQVLTSETYFPQVARRICAQFPGRSGRSRLARYFQVDEALGLLLPFAHEMFGEAVVLDGVL